MIRQGRAKVDGAWSRSQGRPQQECSHAGTHRSKQGRAGTPIHQSPPGMGAPPESNARLGGGGWSPERPPRTHGNAATRPSVGCRDTRCRGSRLLCPPFLPGPPDTPQVPRAAPPRGEDPATCRWPDANPPSRPRIESSSTAGRSRHRVVPARRRADGGQRQPPIHATRSALRDALRLSCGLTRTEGDTTSATDRPRGTAPRDQAPTDDRITRPCVRTGAADSSHHRPSHRRSPRCTPSF